ncbi:uncharacterized protein RCC_05910 [Ramularia collo-cygni]|uniref:Uncharacterized protein n=1 Tax=Ramularia collo-cygni TaxID=112498 RepID=A0A2D3VH47_9PEZI|nr:uncharacterized protein RCC_05910 [Ramularia collo-cygni]CZT20053.1 uncharacterized protein RCC_05910 [Ramularia collo-cygni]
MYRFIKFIARDERATAWATRLRIVRPSNAIRTQNHMLALNSDDSRPSADREASMMQGAILLDAILLDAIPSDAIPSARNTSSAASAPNDTSKHMEQFSQSMSQHWHGMGNGEFAITPNQDHLWLSNEEKLSSLSAPSLSPLPFFPNDYKREGLKTPSETLLASKKITCLYHNNSGALLYLLMSRRQEPLKFGRGPRSFAALDQEARSQAISHNFKPPETAYISVPPEVSP